MADLSGQRRSTSKFYDAKVGRYADVTKGPISLTFQSFIQSLGRGNKYEARKQRRAGAVKQAERGFHDCGVHTR